MMLIITPITYIALVVLVLSLAIFIIYYIKSNFNDSKATKGQLNYTRPYSVKIDFNKNIVSTYTHDGRSAGNEYSLDAFTSQLDNEGLERWKSWMNEIEKSGVEELTTKSQIFGIHFLINTRKKTTKDLKWYKLTYVSQNNSSYFFTAIQLSTRAVKKINNPNTLTDKEEFIERIEKLGVSANGAMVVLDFGLHDMISRRYGTEVAIRYVKELWEEIDDYNSSFCYAAHYDEDVFVLYYPTYTDKHIIDKHMKNLYDNFIRNVVFENYRFDIVTNIGVSFVGIFTHDILGVIKEAHEAAIVAKNTDTHIFYYNERLEKEYRKKRFEEKQLDNIIEKMNINPEYYPILSLHSGSTVGYFSSIDLKKYGVVNGLNEVFEYAREVDKEAALFKTFNQKQFSSFNKFESRKSNKLFVFCELKYLNDLIHIASNATYKDIKIVAILTHYYDLVDAGEQGTDLLTKAKQAKIEIGVVANEDMQTSIIGSLRLLNWLLIPIHMTTTINEDQRTKIMINNIVDSMSRFNLKILAWNVDSYVKAETLKSIGVGYMHGPILDSRQDYENNSVRKIAKLLDERE